MENSVIVFGEDGQTIIDEYTVGKEGCVGITANATSVTVYFRSAEDGVQEKPYKLFIGFKCIVTNR